MPYRKLILIAFFLLGLPLLFMGVMQQEGETEIISYLHTELATYGEQGPHLIGTRGFVINCEASQEIKV
jgi:hypothetical protein